MNIRLLIKFSVIRLLLKILIIIHILLFTGYIAASICLGNIYLWVCLMALTFNSNISSRHKVVAIHIAFYKI